MLINFELRGRGGARGKSFEADSCDVHSRLFLPAMDPRSIMRSDRIHTRVGIEHFRFPFRKPFIHDKNKRDTPHSNRQDMTLCAEFGMTVHV